MKTGKYRAYIERLEKTTVLICANYPKKLAREVAMGYVQNNPTEFSQYDTIIIVKEVEKISVDLVIMGA
jgi:hypothetical protein